MDSNVILWSGLEPRKVSRVARAFMEDPSTTLLISVVTPWELAVKMNSGKLELDDGLETFLEQQMAELDLEELFVNRAHALRTLGLPSVHRDPFDRMLVAQALVEGVPVITNDARFDGYGVTRIW